jgi:hypothetical protein
VIQRDVSFARDALGRSQSLLQRGDHAAAEELATRALTLLTSVRRAHWEAATGHLQTAVTIPLCVHCSALPLHWQLSAKMPSAGGTVNILPSGDFEDVARLRDAGWQVLEHASPGVHSEVSLTAQNARRGTRCLQIAARIRDATALDALRETPTVWVNSPPLPVTGDRLLRIGGWVRIVDPVAASRDGLMIFDSLGGPALAVRLRQISAWQPFTLYRAVKEPTEVTLTVALTGYGAALLDDLSITPLPLPQIENATPAVTSRSAGTTK